MGGMRIEFTQVFDDAKTGKLPQLTNMRLQPKGDDDNSDGDDDDGEDSDYVDFSPFDDDDEESGG